MDTIRILICDDHPIFRAGTIKSLENQPGLFVVGEAANGNDMITQYEKLLPDLVISDIEMRPLDGTQALKQLKLKYPDIKALFLSVYHGENYIYNIIKIGGLGLIEKTGDKGELLFAINEVISGRQYFGPHYTNEQIAAIIDKYAAPPKPFKLDPDKVPTEIEDKILRLIADFFTSKEIADKLSKSVRTIESHRSELIKKFELKDGNDLRRFAIKYSGAM